MNTTGLALCISTLIHIIPATVAFLSSGSAPELAARPAEILIKIDSQDTNINKNVATTINSSRFRSSPEFDQACKDNPSYTGIGVLFSLDDNYIFSAPEQFPGYKHGLRVGDQIISTELSHGIMKVVINRKSVSIIYYIRPERICTDD